MALMDDSRPLEFLRAALGISGVPVLARQRPGMAARHPALQMGAEGMQPRDANGSS